MKKLLAVALVAVSSIAFAQSASGPRSKAAAVKLAPATTAAPKKKAPAKDDALVGGLGTASSGPKKASAVRVRGTKSAIEPSGAGQ